MSAVQAIAYPTTPLEHALAYAALGFKVFPLHTIADDRCTCGDADCRSKAKHPRTARGAHDATTDEPTIRAWWSQWPDANVGMTLEGLAVVDVDPRNGGDDTLVKLQQAHGQLPDTATALTGGGGQHYVYRVPDARRLPGKLGDGIDLKHGAGAYIVVAPSIHASGVAYCWEASADLLEGYPLASLPAWIGSAAPAASLPTIAATGLILPEQVLELRSALAFIDPDDRDTWLRIGMALHSTDAPNALGLWIEWSQRSAKFDPTDQGRVWASFKTKSNALHVESIFALATERGWVNPASGAAHQFNEETEAAIARANAAQPIELVDLPEPAPTAAFPVPALNQLAEWIRCRYALTHPAVTTQTVLALAALGASRVYVGEDGSPCHVCLGVVAESTILTAYARDAVAKVLDGAGLRRMMRGTRANAPTQVYATLWRSPAAIHVISDYGHLAQFAKRQPSGVLDQAFSVMADAYNSSALYVDSAAEAGMKPSATDDQLVVRNPALTTLLLSTREQMGSLLQRGELARGLLAYQLPVIAQTSDAIEHVPDAGPLPAELIERLLAVRRITGGTGDRSMQEIFGAQPCFKPNLVRVRYAVPFTEYAQAIRGVSDELEHRPLVLAAIGSARRLANVMAPWLDPGAPVATRDILNWTTSYVITALRAWLDQYRTLGNDDGKVDVGQKVVETIAGRRKAGVPRGKLHMYCRPFGRIRDHDKRNALLDSLIADGEICEVVPDGKRAKTLVLARYVRPVELKVVK